MKKTAITILVAAMLCMPMQLFGMSEEAVSPVFSQGEYFQLGSYNDEAILWKCISVEDENGTLLISDKILCYKAYAALDEEEYTNYGIYGRGFWEGSSIRAWLNSTATEGNVDWPDGNPPDSKDASIMGPYLPYDNEKGFLAEGNFTKSERSVMKSVSQWQILSEENIHLATNGVKWAFQTNYNGRYYSLFKYLDITWLDHIEGAMYRVSDTVFLIDQMQLYKMWSGFGTVEASPTEKAVAPFKDLLEESLFMRDIYNLGEYWIRTSTNNITYTAHDETGYSAHLSVYAHGVRPAFYLNEHSTVIKSGSGTEDDPYVIDGRGQEDIAIFCNGEELPFDQPTMEENARLLVPMRGIFEALGAEVEWNNEDKSVTAVKEETVITVQIDSTEMSKNGDEIVLDTPPRLVGGRTLVPVRAVSEALDARVEWTEDLRRVVIDIPGPQDFGDGVGRENWHQDWWKELYGDEPRGEYTEEYKR